MLSDYAASIGRRPADLHLVHGQYVDVVLGPTTGSAWRFPLYEEERRRLPEHARRLNQVGALGLPFATPRVRSVRAAAALGEACIETSLIPGSPLEDGAQFGACSRHRLGAHIADALIAIRSVDASEMNILVDASLGVVTGMSDWDSARLGDPAVDVAAVTVSLDLEIRQEILRMAPVLGHDLTRADAYRATFALQEALFGVEPGDDSAVAAGLAHYRR